MSVPCHNLEFNTIGWTDWILTGPSTSPWLPVESWVGKGFISLSTIFWYKALKLNGSTVKGNVPVNIAYMFTPLKENMTKKKSKWSGTRKTLGLGCSDCSFITINVWQLLKRTKKTLSLLMHTTIWARIPRGLLMEGHTVRRTQAKSHRTKSSS